MKDGRGKKSPYLQMNRLRITLDFSSETMQASREWSEIFKVMKQNKLPPT